MAKQGLSRKTLHADIHAHGSTKKARIEAPAPTKSTKSTKFRTKSSPRPEQKSKMTSTTAANATANTRNIDDKTPSSNLSAKRKGKQKVQQENDEGISSSSSDGTSSLPRTFKVIAGSYEKLLYGLEGSTFLSEEKEGEVKFDLKPIFMFPAHVSCIKAVAASPSGGKWLATGSADEIVKVWDLRRKKEIGGLMHHEGSITHLLFPSRSHLLSASEDGTLCIFHARDWSVLRALRGHKGRVNSVSVHPSGKVALSVGKDRTLRMWDLMRGKGVASTKLGKEGEIVRWSTTGSLFAVQSGSTIDVYTTDVVLIHTINHPSRLHDIKFCKRVKNPDASDTTTTDNNNNTSEEEELLFAGAEDKKLSIYTVSTNPDKIPRVIAEMVGHSNRIKAIQTLSIALPSRSQTDSKSQTNTRKSTTIVSTVSSDGKIHIYDLAALPSDDDKRVIEITPVAEYDTKGTRLTCVTLADGEAVSGGESMNGKRKRVDMEEEEEDDDDDEDEDEEGWGGVDDSEGEEEDEEEIEAEEEEEKEEEVEGESE